MTSQSTITPQCNDNAWHTQPNNRVLSEYTATEEGFPAHAQEKRQRLATNGLDERENSNHVSLFHNASGQLQSLLIWILIIAGVIFALLGESVDVIAVVVLNAIIVFYQEFSAEKPAQHSQR